MQPDGRVLVGVDAGDPRIGPLHFDAQFLVQFARQRLRRGLAVMDFAAGKFPPARVYLAGGTLREKKRAVGALDHRRRDFDHGKRGQTPFSFRRERGSDPFFPLACRPAQSRANW